MAIYISPCYQGTSNEYPQWRNKKNIHIFYLKKVPYHSALNVFTLNNWDTSIPHHVCLQIWKSPFSYLLTCPKYCWIKVANSVGLIRCCILQHLVLFAQACLSQYFGLLWCENQKILGLGHILYLVWKMSVSFYWPLTTYIFQTECMSVTLSIRCWIY